MPDNKISRYFLGANSAQGFYSLYDGFASPEDGCFLHVIKGGPGCGKSSFMKYIGARAEERGLDVEYIFCSGDPDSLDAVRLPALGVAYADGTAPHVLDSPYPGAGGLYLDLGRFYDKTALRPKLSEITDINRRYRLLYADAYSLLAAAGAVGTRGEGTLMTPELAGAVRKRAVSAANRELGRSESGSGRVEKRFLSAISCKGNVFFGETLDSLCPRVCLLDNTLGFAGVYLTETAAQAQRRGYDIVLCPDCLRPERPEAVLIPEAGLAFLAADKRRGPDGEVYRRIRLDALADAELLRRVRAGMRTAAKLQSALIDEATAILSEAKALHDELEAVYNPHVDFDGLYAAAREHAQALGLE